MGVFGKIFGKKATETKIQLQKFEKRDLVEAAVAGAVMVAFADGECEDAELAKLQEIIESNDSFSHFQSEVGVLVDKFARQFKAGFIMGKMKAMKELADIQASAEEKEEVFIVMVLVAQADGEVEPAEKTLLIEIGRKLGLNPAAYGIE
jgi:tellurite resistance protein TerB